jgi:CspA family cold shock protein
MAIGKVKWFNNAKGYGFLNASNVDHDIFIHYSSIEMEGYKYLKAGQVVEYNLQDGPKGLHAVNIKPFEESREDAFESEVRHEVEVA